MQEIAPEFAAETGVRLRVSTASTGKLYAQIINGAPFDILLAADRDRPQRLEASGAAVEGSRFTYAEGQLVLWSRQETDCRGVLNALDSGRLAIANPDTAPYGLAAQQFLEHEGLWDAIEPKLVQGESVIQALQFAATGNARLGFVAASLLLSDAVPDAACTWSRTGIDARTDTATGGACCAAVLTIPTQPHSLHSCRGRAHRRSLPATATG